MFKLILNHKKEFQLLIIGISILIFHYFFLGINNQSLIYPDSESYFAAAKNIYYFYRGHNIRPMLLAAIHGFPLIFTDNKLSVINFNILLNCICFISASILLYKILKRLQ